MAEEKNIYPILPLRNTVVFPHTTVFLVVGREASIKALKKAQDGDNKILAVAEVYLDESEKAQGKLYQTGTLCQIGKVMGNDKNGYQVMVTGLERFQIEKFSTHEEGFVQGEGFLDTTRESEEPEAIALFNNLKTLSKEILSLFPRIEESTVALLDGIQKQIDLVYISAAYLNLSVTQAQDLLESSNIKEKMNKILSWLGKEREVLLLEKDIRDKVGKRLGKVQREHFLREQLRAIKEELGENGGETEQKYEKRISEAGFGPEAEKVAREELRRLESLHPSSAEYHVSQNYLEWLLSIPWNKFTDDNIDLKKASALLDEHHYGLDKVKKRILQHLAVAKLKNDVKGSILCLVGPPGVGKTSLGQSIAEAIGRKFVRASLGGVRDESEIRGHRRTYIGSMPGKIIQNLKRVGVNNPVMLLDEIDKLSSSFHGDPTAAMLEVLDPEQNNTFIDHYIDTPVDLSKILFIATANRLDTIPGPLRDRLEIIELTGYTTEEKIHIAEKFIWKEALKENGLQEGQVKLDEGMLRSVIEHYTREAGVRELKRKIKSLCHNAAYDIVTNKDHEVSITEKKLQEYLGPYKYLDETKIRHWGPGVVTGLAWTPVGGDVLYLECQRMPGKGNLKLTGQLGDVMKESAEIAMSYVRSKLCDSFLSDSWDKTDIHLHIPAGAIPKDGPSAGITLLTALASLATRREVPQDLAMTGELSLTGSVLPVGGIKEKVIAAHRAKIKRVILPKDNEKDLSEIPKNILEDIKFHLVDSAEKVLQIALEIDIGKRERYWPDNETERHEYLLP